MKKLKFDIMVKDRFYCTMRMPIEVGMIQEYIGDEPVLNLDAIVKKVLERRPTLKNKNFKIAF